MWSFWNYHSTILPHNIIFPQLSASQTSNILVYHAVETGTQFKLPLKVIL